MAETGAAEAARCLHLGLMHWACMARLAEPAHHSSLKWRSSLRSAFTARACACGTCSRRESVLRHTTIGDSRPSSCLPRAAGVPRQSGLAKRARLLFIAHCEHQTRTGMSEADAPGARSYGLRARAAVASQRRTGPDSLRTGDCSAASSSSSTTCANGGASAAAAATAGS
jgi:hypothetical protein